MNLPVATHNPPPSAADDLARALAALSETPPDLPRDEWWRVLAALRSMGVSESAARTWSSGSPGFNERDFRDTWRSLSANGGIGPATLFFIARKYGTWRPDPNAPRPPAPTPAELARQEAERAKRATVEDAERQAKADAAAADARPRPPPARAPPRPPAPAPADPAHPYLMRKRIAPPPDMRQEGSALLVPVTWPGGDLRGLQVITADGKKRFSYGTSFQGCLWWARPPADGVAAPLIIITEGVADALTVAAAVDEAAAACAFSASNLPAVAGVLRRCWPAAKIIVAADSDEAGQRAAEKAQAADPRLIVRRPSFDRAR